MSVSAAVSATAPDWSREAPRRFWDPSRKLVKAIRDYQRHTGLRQKLAVLRHRFWSVVTGADIPLATSIGGGLMLPHPNGVVIHPMTTIGPNCMIFQQVTLGTNREGGGHVPRVGGHVDIGPGARILGAVVLGDHAVVGANAVVLRDVPEGRVAVGVPARILESGANP